MRGELVLGGHERIIGGVCWLAEHVHERIGGKYSGITRKVKKKLIEKKKQLKNPTIFLKKTRFHTI